MAAQVDCCEGGWKAIRTTISSQLETPSGHFALYSLAISLKNFEKYLKKKKLGIKLQNTKLTVEGKG